MMIGMVGMVAFNLVDTFFVGKLGTDALAAMGFTLSVVLLQGSISMGLGIGTAAIISRSIGQGDNQQVRRLTVDSLFLSLVLVICIIVPGLFTIRPLFSLLGAQGHFLEMVYDYMFIWFLGVPFVVIPMVGNNAIRAAGNTMIPSIIMLVAIVVNTVLDPLLIFGIGPFPRLELKGAAIATVIARAMTMVASLMFLRYRFDMLTTRLPSPSQLLHSWKQILHIGAPAALNQLMLPLSLAAITRLLASYGHIAVAAFAISNRIEMFALSPLMSLGAVMIPFIGQNAGANKLGRIKEGVKYSYSFSMFLSVAIFIAVVLLGKQIALTFNKDPDVVSISYQYLIIVSLSYGFYGIVGLTSAFFNALKKPALAMFITSLRAIILYIPLAWIGSKIWELPGVFIAAAVASVISGIVGMVLLRASLRK